MWLKKNKKVNKEIEKSKNNNIEFVDLNTNATEEVTNTLEKRINYKVIIISLLLVIIFVVLLPTITSIFDSSSPENYTNTVNSNSGNDLVNGYIQIDRNKANMTVKDVRFYNFTKRSNNTISYNYKAEEVISNTLSLQLYIEIYNRSETIIYREMFNPSSEIEKGPVLSANIVLNPNIYKEAYYVKIVEIKTEEAIITNSLICEKEFTDGIFKLNYNIRYNFGENALLSYEVTKQATIIEPETDEGADGENTENTTETDNENTENTAETDKYNDIFLKEEADVSNTNATDYKREDNYLNYTIDLRTIDLQDSDYELLYNIGTVERTIKIIEESNGWSCKNE